MARNKRTMRAQEPDLENLRRQAGIDPRNLPVPREQVITQEDYNRAIDDEVRRRARERGATDVPNAPPPSRRRVRTGVGVGAIFDPFALAEDFGAIAGEAVGEAANRVPEDEQRRREAAERELARRQRENAAPFPDEILRNGVPTGEVVFRIPPKLTPRGDPVGGMMRPPVFNPAPPAPPAPRKRNRVQRALHQIQRVTSNPWAQLGIFGLGVLGGRKRSRNALSPLALSSSDDFVTQSPLDSLTPINAGALPFSSSGFNYGGGGTPTATATACGCKPKKRGPKRRCLERAQVAWRSGRYKGKLAGTRCVRWEK